MSTKCKILMDVGNRIVSVNSAWPVVLETPFTNASGNPPPCIKYGDVTEKTISADDYLQQAREFLRDNNKPRQIQALASGAKAYPQNANMWHQLGRALFFDDQYKHAVTALNQACKLDKTNPDILKSLEGAQRKASSPSFDR